MRADVGDFLNLKEMNNYYTTKDTKSLFASKLQSLEVKIRKELNLSVYSLLRNHFTEFLSEEASLEIEKITEEMRQL